MRIGIDARILTKHVTGAGRVVNALINQLPRYPEHQFVIFHRKETRPEVCGCNVQHVEADIPVSTIKNLLYMHRFVNTHKLEVYYYPFIDMPLGLNPRTVAVVHDLYYMHDRQYFARRSMLQYWLIKTMGLWRMRSASALIADSAVTRNQVRQFRVLKKKPVYIVQLCSLLPETLPKATNLPNGIRPASFYLCVGNNRNHKNIRRLLQAFQLAKNSGLPPEIKLVLCGYIDGRYEDPRKLISELNLETDVTHYGTVTDSTLSLLYSQCVATVVPSLYEGFGLPALEAAVKGRPVIASTTPAFREILGDAGIYCDPYDVNQWAVAITKLATNRQWADTLSHECRARATHFTPERFGSETIQALTQNE